MPASTPVDRYTDATPESAANHWELPEFLAAIDDSAVIEEILAIFLSSTQERLKMLRPPAEHKALRETAHALKGSCLQLGASGLANLATELDDLLRTGQPVPSEGLVARMEKEFAALASSLEAYLPVAEKDSETSAARRR